MKELEEVVTLDVGSRLYVLVQIKLPLGLS